MPMMAAKWDYEKHAYQPYQLPEGAAAWMKGMQDEVSCAECGKKLPVEDTYVSQLIHEPFFGIGYFVCETCHEREMRERVATDRELGKGW